MNQTPTLVGNVLSTLTVYYLKIRKNSTSLCSWYSLHFTDGKTETHKILSNSPKNTLPVLAWLKLTQDYVF